MGDVQGDIAKEMRAAGRNPYGGVIHGLDRVPRREPTREHDIREQASRFRHALEVIRDAEGLDAEALRTIAYAVVGPRIELAAPSPRTDLQPPTRSPRCAP